MKYGLNYPYGNAWLNSAKIVVVVVKFKKKKVMKFKKFVSNGQTLIVYRIDEEKKERIHIDINGSIMFFDTIRDVENTIDATPLEFAEFYDKALQKIMGI